MVGFIALALPLEVGDFGPPIVVEIVSSAAVAGVVVVGFSFPSDGLVGGGGGGGVVGKEGVVVAAMILLDLSCI